jgi:hypothetical protein
MNEVSLTGVSPKLKQVARKEDYNTTAYAAMESAFKRVRADDSYDIPF